VFGCGGAVVAALELGVQDLHADIELCTAALAVAARGLSRELAVDAHQAERQPLRLLRGPGTAGPASARPEPRPVPAARLMAARDRGERPPCDTVRSG
jgi:hypothetical protein